ncbi:MAG: hypothetical protein U5L45_09890 [Saprospiraceae bacterium]|nr:hypothetical protein [Saprospiraceae bacterium]
MVHFSALPKNEPHSPFSREQNEREKKKLFIVSNKKSENHFRFSIYTKLRLFDEVNDEFDNKFLVVVDYYQID